MTERTQKLLNEAMALAPGDRADVAAELLVSLDEPIAADQASIQSAWNKEIENRARRVDETGASSEPWEDVRDRIADRLSSR
jgi:hypothetical protein